MCAPRTPGGSACESRCHGRTHRRPARARPRACEHPVEKRTVGLRRSATGSRRARSRRRHRARPDRAGCGGRLGRISVDLDGPGAREERFIGEIGSEQEEEVGLVHRLVARAVPSSPLIPTSCGLSTWIDSLPRSVWPTGLRSVAASSRTSSYVPPAPAPQNRVTVFAALIRSARSRTWSEARTVTPRVKSQAAWPVLAVEGRPRTSPGITSTDTPSSPSECWIAVRARRGNRLRLTDELAVVAALLEQPLWTGLLQNLVADPRAGDLGCERYTRRRYGARLVQALDDRACFRFRSCRRRPLASRSAAPRPRPWRAPPPPRRGRAPTRSPASAARNRRPG